MLVELLLLLLVVILIILLLLLLLPELLLHLHDLLIKSFEDLFPSLNQHLAYFLLGQFNFLIHIVVVLMNVLDIFRADTDKVSVLSVDHLLLLDLLGLFFVVDVDALKQVLVLSLVIGDHKGMSRVVFNILFHLGDHIFVLLFSRDVPVLLFS